MSNEKNIGQYGKIFQLKPPPLTFVKVISDHIKLISEDVLVINAISDGIDDEGTSKCFGIHIYDHPIGFEVTYSHIVKRPDLLKYFFKFQKLRLNENEIHELIEQSYGIDD
jgi:hypothetical protein